MEFAVVDDETLAIDVIAEADGEFMGTMHTVRHYREDWVPEISDRGDYGSWVAAGGKSFRERAKARVAEILSEHHLPDLSVHLQEKLTKITRRAQKRIDTSIRSTD
jgi:trimethylamine:corrinoid methyltransferase-like protein